MPIENGYDTSLVWRMLGVDITENFETNFAHVYPTLNYGNDCTYAPPFIGNCNYSLTEEVMGNLIPDLVPPRRALDENFYQYEQIPAVSMAEKGWAYIPKSCFEINC